MDQPAVRHVLFYTALTPGNLMLVQCDDGAYRIYKNDQPMDGRRWPAHQIQLVTEEYYKVRRELAGVS